MGHTATHCSQEHDPWNIAGKICLVTGATNGIGRAAALALAQAGAEVVVGGRQPERCAAVQDQIAELTGRRPEALCCDFNSLTDVRRAAQEYLDSGRSLDVLLNNAGAVFGSRRYSADGYEASMAVNHLAPFLLSCMLWPRLRESAPARIVVVASDAHRSSKALHFDDLMREHSFYFNMESYGRSKLCNLLFTKALAKRIEGSGVTVNAMHPSLVYTGLARQNLMGRILMGLLKPFARTPAQGADTAVWLCTEPALIRANGGYYFNRAPHQPRADACDEAIAEQLWQASEVLVDHRWNH